MVILFAMHIYIVTGTTRGLGRALAEAIVGAGDWLLSLSSAPERLGHRRCNVQCDLRRLESVPISLERLLSSVNPENAKGIILVNNAGVLEPIGPVDTLEEKHILDHLLVNQAAPAILMSAFIRLTEGIRCRRRIINISSGAGRHPYAGWSMYCASKAALNMMSQCIGAEQELRDDAVAVSAVSPGKMETDMQAQARAADVSRFPAREDFIRAKLQGDLIAPQRAAEMILSLDKQGYFKNGGVYDLREIAAREGLPRL